MNIKKSKTASLEPQTFLDTSGMARKVAEFRKDEQIYSQGDAAKSVMYIQKGNVKFSALSASGVGTTRSRVNIFMNKFRKLSFIEYHNRKIKINKSLLTFVLEE